MKKLLIAMTAAAVGTCAWATEGAGGDPEPTTPTTTTYFTETFAGWSNDAEAGYVTSVATPWSYGTVAVDEQDNPVLNTANPQADELKVVNGALSLNTGSKVLRGAFGAVAIPDAGLYFNATIAFKDPSDTLPTLMSSDKFAIVALDNVESLEAGLTNINTKASTNLWVIAHHETEGKRAYRLTGNLESTWFKDSEGVDVTHTIVVKAYNNVVGTRAGFLVMLDGAICTVKESYAISTGNVIDFTTAVDGSNNYLGYDNSEVSLGERYLKGQLLLSMVSNSSLASVDFQGQGVIDELSLADAGADFGPDVTSKTVTFTGFDSAGIASISPSLNNNGVYTIPSNTENGDITFTVSLNTGYELKVTAGDKVTVSGSAPTYTVTYDYDGGESYSIALDVFEPAAYVGGTAYKTFSLALAAALKDGGTLKLSTDVTAADFGNYTYLYVESGKSLVLDLNGKTIQGSGTDELPTPSIFNEGILTIKDSARTGCVKSSGYGAVLNAGTLTIEAGIFDGSVTTDGGETSITGGKFLKAANASITVDTDKYVVDADTEADYYIVKDKPAAPTTYAVNYTAMNATITKDDLPFTSGTELASGKYTFKVVAAEGYKVDSVMVGAQNVTVNNDGTFEVEVTNMPVMITVMVQENAFMVNYTATNATITKDDLPFMSGTKLASGTYTFTVVAAEGYKVSSVMVGDQNVTVNNDGTFEVEVTNMPVMIMVMTESVPLQPLPENATNADVLTALGTPADTAVIENIKTVADYTAFQAWAAKVDGGTSAVAGSQNAYAAYVLDAAGLLTETDKLADADIKVKAFAQDATAQTAGTFALEIKIKDCEIGPNANLEKLAELIIAEGTSELDLTKFSTDNVTKTVAIEGDKAKFKVNAKDGNVKQFFFKMKFK